MTDKQPDEPAAEEARPAEQDKAQEAHEQDEENDLEEDENLDVDEIEQELLDAMKKLRRTNKNVEEYLDGIAREAEPPAPDQTDTPAE